MSIKDKIILTPKQEKWLAAHFKHTKNDEIVAKLGISHSTLHRIARRMGLKKSRQFLAKCQANAAAEAYKTNRRNNWPPKGYRIPNANRFKPGETSEQRLGKERNAQRIAKAAATRRATLEREKLRVRWGLEQRTKLKIGYSKQKVSYRYALRKRGYHIDRGGDVAYIVEGTIRNEIVEQRARKHGIRVMEQLPNVLHSAQDKIINTAMIDKLLQNTNPISI